MSLNQADVEGIHQDKNIAYVAPLYVLSSNIWI